MERLRPGRSLAGIALPKIKGSEGAREAALRRCQAAGRCRPCRAHCPPRGPRPSPPSSPCKPARGALHTQFDFQKLLRATQQQARVIQGARAPRSLPSAHARNGAQLAGQQRSRSDPTGGPTPLTPQVKELGSDQQQPQPWKERRGSSNARVRLGVYLEQPCPRPQTGSASSTQSSPAAGCTRLSRHPAAPRIDENAASSRSRPPPKLHSCGAGREIGRAHV